ncbi:MAG: dicarboxylate/amino acid:cation symporter [Planctomycetes bacterium]|nr:dicarboxylate/amino acid:cation symporter [Planctomycetota bacterium]
MKQGTLQRWILGGLAAGLAAGILASWLAGPAGPENAARTELERWVDQVVRPLGGIFLRLLFMTVLPLVFSCLALGVRELGDVRELGRIGVKTLAFTLVLSAASVGIGLALVNAIGPGRSVAPEARAKLLEDAAREKAFVAEKAKAGAERPPLEGIVSALIPRNPVESAVRAFDGDMLGVMFFALLFGAALGMCGSARTATVVAFLEGLYDVSMWLVGLAMRLAPIGVAALVFSMAATLGPGVVVTLGAYVLTVLLGLGFHQFVVYPVVLRTLCGVRPWEFFSRIRPVMVTAFSTSSSNATLPTTIQVARDRLGIPAKVANFVLTLGSTFNQNGTALFEGVTVLFLAQLYGVELAAGQQLLVLGMALLAGVGTAGVPGGSIPLIVPVLVSVGVPGEGIAVILGVDRFLDMCRTTLNVTGDLVAASYVARREDGHEV